MSKYTGYQIFGAHISTGNTALCYELRRCCPENGSKIDMAAQILDSLPETGAPVIALMDSWYTCQRLWGKAVEKAPRINAAPQASMPSVSQTANTTW